MKGRRNARLGWHPRGDKAVVSDGTCPRVTPLVLTRKCRVPGHWGPRTVPPVLGESLSNAGSDIILALFVDQSPSSLVGRGGGAGTLMRSIDDFPGGS